MVPHAHKTSANLADFLTLLCVASQLYVFKLERANGPAYAGGSNETVSPALALRMRRGSGGGSRLFNLNLFKVSSSLELLTNEPMETRDFISEGSVDYIDITDRILSNPTIKKEFTGQAEADLLPVLLLANAGDDIHRRHNARDYILHRLFARLFLLSVDWEFALLPADVDGVENVSGACAEKKFRRHDSNLLMMSHYDYFFRVS